MSDGSYCHYCQKSPCICDETDCQSHTVKFEPSGRGKAQCPSNPDYPHGKAVGATTTMSGPSCNVKLPYPAPECGVWIIRCKDCPSSVGVTAAGRPDDPISVTMSCNKLEVKEGHGRTHLQSNT